ncbi:MobA-like NTP transferase domain protein [Leptospira yanagawae serovar Saopaulo str. Sao Paulo = ATCC 700523]|uniref:Probable molybdenum cofactor guanylyltransferase n=1 Tax=Leptospira yanagawae serovar Saopaulo str. Sao Paulo = ATCC 700523 TaxID=1249483 RepID=A0A5E8HCQ8_9LEPT|nr:molybdenum cofactor guanylyltransferase [Leptospira yanagawae]EOQ88557.1 MobA-like NTP transferase domain protein [Leptospira yanagawae serovar Saopaulo str. Sao Paulo = ATCC 700523]
MRHTKNDIIFILLAGGQSIRMGKDKAFLPIGDKSTFITKIIQKIKYFNEELYLSLRSEQVKDYSSLFSEDEIIMDQNIPVYGPLLGLLSTHLTLNKTNPDYNAIFVLPIDIPYIKLKTIDRILRHYHINSNSSGIFYQSSNGLEPLCSIYNHQTLDLWLKEIESNNKIEFSLQKKIESLDPQPIFLPLPKVEERYFRNINTEKDLDFFKK